MCLIALSWQPNSTVPLTLLANRDEFFDRPTQAPHRWANGIFAGHDLQSGGTWLGISKNERFAAVTNFREPNVKAGKYSRGKLVTDFLTSSDSPEQHLSTLRAEANLYSGFNLLVGADKQLGYFSNRSNQIKILSPGYYALSNAQLNSPWPKAVRLKKLLEQQKGLELDALLPLLQNPEKASDDQLPITGVEPKIESQLSSAFIKPIQLNGRQYGTRNSTGIRIDEHGKINWIETVYDLAGSSQTSHHQWRLADSPSSQSKLAISSADK